MNDHRLAGLSRRRSDAKAMRRAFRQAAVHGLWVTWPIISIHLLLMMALGGVVGVLEGWAVADGVYFAFVTGYTVGYGHFAPTHLATKILSILIGTVGISLTGVMASVAVRALHHAMPPTDQDNG